MKYNNINITFASDRERIWKILLSYIKLSEFLKNLKLYNKNLYQNKINEEKIKYCVYLYK